MISTCAREFSPGSSAFTHIIKMILRWIGNSVDGWTWMAPRHVMIAVQLVITPNCLAAVSVKTEKSVSFSTNWSDFPHFVFRSVSSRSRISYYNPHCTSTSQRTWPWKPPQRGAQRRRRWRSRRGRGEFAQPQTDDTTAAVSSFHVDPVVDQNTVAGRVRSADRAGPRWRVRLPTWTFKPPHFQPPHSNYAAG